VHLVSFIDDRRLSLFSYLLACSLQTIKIDQDKGWKNLTDAQSMVAFVTHQLDGEKFVDRLQATSARAQLAVDFTGCMLHLGALPIYLYCTKFIIRRPFS
jgi:hypothetical protein